MLTWLTDRPSGAAAAQADQRLLTVDQLRRVLARERARADRNGHHFSLVVFDLPDGRSCHAILAETLFARLRCSDDIGWFDEGRLAAVLPDTPLEGAWHVADEIRRLTAARVPDLACAAYTYPPAWWQRFADTDRRPPDDPSGNGHRHAASVVSPQVLDKFSGARRPAPKEQRVFWPVLSRMHRDCIAWAAGKARRASISGIFEGGATPPGRGPQRGSRVGVADGMLRPENVEELRRHDTSPEPTRRAKTSRVHSRGWGPASIEKRTHGADRPRDRRSTGPPTAARRAAAFRERDAADELGRRLGRPLPIWKRAVDIVGAATAVVLLAPIILVTAVLVRVTSPGPAIFRQLRVGKDGTLFTFYKFRTMDLGADEQKQVLQTFNEQTWPVFKMKDDPRVTPLGRLLRRTSIDELPQLWNVLKGDMSLVGPRPPTIDEVAGYERWHHRRLGLTPGLTGIWQVSGRSLVGFTDWVRMDIAYAERRSWLLDLEILARTIPAVLSGRGAH